jgi:predicted HAD superfamily Cof-like phosphohydrolase
MSINNESQHLPEDNRAIRDIVLFNALAGNTQDQFNTRQMGLYMGLQLEEMAEKLEALGTATRQHNALTGLASFMRAISFEFKEGYHDERFENVNTEEMLDGDVDIFVVTVGAMMSSGADILGAIQAVNTANLAKRTPEGVLVKDANGKITKPDGWTPADLSPFTFDGAW